MIINTGQRTDIPAFYSEWFMNRIREGYVMVRNPFYPEQVTRYSLDPAVVDVLAFCTKDPSPMIPYLDEISPFRQFWFVTITPYGRDIEENVPPKERRIIWLEHQGLIDDPKYAVDAFEKQDNYGRIGIFPGKNLILTHETNDYPLTRGAVMEKLAQLDIV